MTQTCYCTRCSTWSSNQSQNKLFW